MKELYRGKLVRLGFESPEALGRAHARWERDSEYHRLADSDPAQLWSEKKHREWIEKQMERDPMQAFRFSIYTLAEEKLIGYIGVRPLWVHADALIGIAIGERDYWGKGYGTDAMSLIVQYGFLELNLQRMSLSLNSYNPRAQRAYEKAGFKVEGVMRQDTFREGKRTDGIFMGILRREWMAQQGGAI